MRTRLLRRAALLATVGARLRENPIVTILGPRQSMTKSLHMAMQDLKLDQAFIVYPGTKTYRVAENVEVVPLPIVRQRLLGRAKQV
jgi:hypothetical protein